MGWHMTKPLAVLTAFVATLWLGLTVHAEPTTSPASATPAAQSAAIVPLTGQIDDYSQKDFIHRFDQAKRLGAKVIIVDIDSPGGLVTSSMELSRYLKRQDGIRTVAFVREKAYSGAAMVAVACNEIWMSPNSPLGDCAPIIFNHDGSLESMGETERAKEEGPVVDEFLNSARRNGYDPLLLRAMVSLRDSIFVITNDKGELRVVNQKDYDALTKEGTWKLAPNFENVDGSGKLVTVYPKEAIALGLAKGEVASAHDLADKLGSPVVAELIPSSGAKLIEVLNDPYVRSVLLLVFLLSLYIAISAPGHGAAEAMATISVGLLIGVPLLTGYAQWWEVAVIFIGVALCAFELFVFPGHFVSLIVGTLMIIFGFVMTFAGKEPTGLPGWLPSFQSTWHGVRNGLMAVVGASICWFFLTLWLRRYLPSIPYFNKLILTATTGNIAEFPKPGETGTIEPWPFVGTVGVAKTDLRPGGAVDFPYADTTRSAAVVSASGFVLRGTKVVVEEIQGSSVRVRAVG